MGLFGFGNNKLDRDLTQNNFSDRPWFWLGYWQNGQAVVYGRPFYTFSEAQEWARANLDGAPDYQVFPLMTGDASAARQIVISKMMRNSVRPEPVRMGVQDAGQDEI